MGKVTYVVLVYGKQDLLMKCLQTFRLFHPEDPLIVADNGGPNGDLTKQMAEIFKAKYICNPSNDSLSRLMNMGMEAAETDYVCIVTSGVEFTTSLTYQFEKDFENDPLTVVVGGLLMYPDGRIQHGGGRRFWNYNAMGHYGQGKYPHQAKLCTIPAYRLYVTGATAAIRKDFWKEHPYDEKLTMTCEDTDMCFTAWLNGKRVFYDPIITSIHKEGANRGRTTEEKKRNSPLLFDREQRTNKLFQEKYTDEQIYKFDKEVNRLNALLHPELPKAFVRNGAAGDVARTLQVYDELTIIDDSEMVVITQVPELFKDRPLKGISRYEDEYAVSSFINLDLANERDRSIPIVEAYCKEAGITVQENKPIDLNTTEADWFAVRELSPEFNWYAPYIVFHMAVMWPGKTFPLGLWEYLIGNLKQRGFNAVSVGTGNDYGINGDGIINLINHTSLHMMRALCEHAKLFIGPDSGPLHIADGACPAIGLFTLNKPEILVSKQVTGIMTKAECGGCMARHGLTTGYKCDFSDNDPRQYICVRGFNPEEILLKALELTGKK